MIGRRRVVVAAAALAATLLLPAGCAINPATGQRQLALIGERDEIAIGRDNDRQIVASMGAYDDDALQAYVSSLGAKLAAVSERPDLPWTFRVIDDPTVNAFALPGGFVYVTRGILDHLNSEAELAAVMGHEIGHVTARHGVNQMSKQQLAQLGLGIGMAVSEDVAALGDLAQQGLGLLFLKYSRDDERQADDLGLRYLIRAGYDPRPMPGVYDMLRRVSEAHGGGSVPGWLSTHPEPENREQRIAQAIAATGRDFSGLPVRRDAYLDQVDGVVFGEDPRHGYFDGPLFVQPELAIRLRFPEGWTTVNRRDAVLGASAGQDAMIELTLSDAASPAAGLQAFLAGEGIEAGDAWHERIGGLVTASRAFRVPRETGALDGLAAFIEHGGKVYRLVGYGTTAAWSERRGAVAAALDSFAAVTDPKLLGVEPRRLRVVAAGGTPTLAALASRQGATVGLDTLALINHLDAGASLAADRRYKVVVGGR